MKLPKKSQFILSKEEIKILKLKRGNNKECFIWIKEDYPLLKKK